MKQIIFIIMLVSAILIIGCTTDETLNIEKNSNNQLKINDLPETKELKEEVRGLLEPVTINQIKFIVTDVTGYKKMGTSMFGKETKGEFYKVCLTIENLGKTSTYLYDSNMIEAKFVLADNQGRQFDSSLESELYIDNSINLMEQLQPNLPIEGCKIFELPADAKGLKLLISKGWLTNKAIAITIKDSEIKHLEAETSVQEKIDQQMDDVMDSAQKQMDELIGQFN